MATMAVGLSSGGLGGLGARRGAQAPATRVLPETAARRERDLAACEFRSQVEAWLREQGCEWPAVTARESWHPDGGVATTRHYATPGAPLKGVGWWGRLLYGPTGTRRRRI